MTASSMSSPYHNENTPLAIQPSSTLQTLPSSHRFDSPAGALPTGQLPDWDAAFDEQRRERWLDKAKIDLEGWRGGHGCVARFSTSGIDAVST